MNVRCFPPCEAACPVNTEAGRYARLVAGGRFKEAFEVICRTNPFPSVCAYICQRLCEKNCRRSQLDSPVALRALKRFVIHTGPAPVSLPAQTQKSARVAVVGAGPAGLTAAHDLRRQGFGVSVFERLDRPGGMLNVIPRYRLPQKALDADIEAILSSGIDLTCNCEVGAQATVGEFIDRGFDAVIVASGLSRSRGIAVPGFGAQRFVAAIPWMADVWSGRKVDVGRRVAVIGGGNVAIDVARTARRLGAEYVALVCLESEKQMPAEAEEVHLAREEGVRILPQQALKRVLNCDGQIVAVELMGVPSVFDSSGRFSPVYDPSRLRTLNIDMVVLSIGQGPDRSWARGTSIRTDSRGRILADRETHLTGNPRVFLAGESLRGPGSAIAAVSDGHSVARVVARFLEDGEVRKPEAGKPKPLDAFPPDVIARLRRIDSIDAKPEPFAPGEPEIDEERARREAGRCLGCLAGAVIDETSCASCLTCFRVCPLHAIRIEEAISADPVRCQACGLCAAVCPANAINLAFWSASGDDGLGHAPRDGASGEKALVACRQARNGDILADRVVSVPCLARLKPVDLLRLFEAGFKTVSLRPCAEDDCMYPTAHSNIQSLMDQARALLARSSLEARIELCPPSHTDRPGFPSQE